MKIATMMIGVRVLVEDNCSTDLLMNYAMNAMGMKLQNSGPIREVEVRELGIPDISDVTPKQNLAPMGTSSVTEH